jgi:uncharacterized membrane protein YbjE (DUF340 family)
MTIKILLVLVAGILSGIYIIDPSFYGTTDIFLSIGLSLLLFFVGIDIGSNKKVFGQLKKMGLKIILVPVSAGLGCLAGGIATALIFNMPILEGAAVAAGFGWYSLAPILIAPYSAELSAIAFLTNVFREILAIAFISYTAKYIGYFETVALGGATSMDTTLPIISRNTDAETTVVAFVSGMIMTMSVPVLVPFFVSLLQV